MGSGQVSCAVVPWDRWSEVVKGFDIHDCVWVRGCGGAAPEIACFNPSLDMTPLPAVLKLFQWMPRFFLCLLTTHPFFQQHFLKVRRLQSRYDDIIVSPKLSGTTAFCLCSSWTVTRLNYSSSPKSGVGFIHALSWRSNTHTFVHTSAYLSSGSQSCGRESESQPSAAGLHTCAPLACTAQTDEPDMISHWMWFLSSESKSINHNRWPRHLAAQWGLDLIIVGGNRT